MASVPDVMTWKAFASPFGKSWRPELRPLGAPGKKGVSVRPVWKSLILSRKVN